MVWNLSTSVQGGTVSLGKPIPMFGTIDTTYLFYYWGWIRIHCSQGKQTVVYEINSVYYQYHKVQY